MPDFAADGIEITIENDYWRLFNQKGLNSLSPFFAAMRGDGLVHYTPEFGESRGLPGDKVAVEYIRAVVVGFDERRQRWTLGLHIAMSNEVKPRFVELVHWGTGNNPQSAVESHTAGRVLAEYLRCPLKLFGVTKPTQAPSNPRATMTGPLVPHERVDMPLHEVRHLATTIEYPLALNNIWLGMAGNLTLRLPREATDKEQGEAPAFHQVVIDKNNQAVRLIPPTSLLGMFFSGSGRSVPFAQIRNVEFRHTILRESSAQPGDDGLSIDVTITTHTFGVYLTLPTEALLLLRTQHVASSDLQRRRLKMVSGARTDLDTSATDMTYMREHQRDQKMFERVRNFAEMVAISIAGTLDRPVVKTKVGSEV